MNLFGTFTEKPEKVEGNREALEEISQEALDKFDALMGDEDLESEHESEKPEEEETHEPNSNYEIDKDVYETDDTGKTYKKNGQLLPNMEYTIHGNTYRTDKDGNLVSCDSEPKYTEDNTRNQKEQRESGGDERKEDDDGGHLVARVLGGAEGLENLVPMRRTINRGDYKIMENEISKALQDGKKVSMHIELEYKEGSHRPSKIKVTYSIDGKKTEVVFDNDENSKDLLDVLSQKISDEDHDRLKEQIEDMEEDGDSVTITSVKTEYDEDGNPVQVTVGILNETTGEKTYRTYAAR